ncbi:Hsp70 family protein [Paracoccus xiamenensis]|uniref:Hsp70 family protein n=1 Tax=Paracoccus xiamenensis TaxID=2714901 RepID=UPI00140B843A|nr:Hsp70 family protein [Paracoccus xiamenensis]NHF73266.1 Hsp70 family protein [Paracoccus xiamenensis]
MQTLAIDFGTSNSAVALSWPGRASRLPMEDGGDTLPTAVFFPAGRGDMLIGAAAADALIAGQEGRYMRALKSALGLPLMSESRLIGGRRRTLADIIAAFLAELRERAEATAGMPLRRVLSGRPVHFHTNDPSKDAQAEADLRACYLDAGFEEVAFMAEPEAAALASHRPVPGEALGLVVDIGGGTSDFSVFRSRAGQLDILASHGIRLGGTDFDQSVSLTHAMPLLGLGGQLRRVMGDELLPVPRAPYVDLATWARIPFLYTQETRRLAADMARMAVDRPAMSRFRAVIEDETGHDLAFAVERGKIAANGPEGKGRILLETVEPGLSALVTAASLDEALAAYRDGVRQAMADTIASAQVAPAAIGEVVLVGGSSLMQFVAADISVLFPQARLRKADVFTAVVDGLARAAACQEQSGTLKP